MICLDLKKKVRKKNYGLGWYLTAYYDLRVIKLHNLITDKGIRMSCYKDRELSTKSYNSPSSKNYNSCHIINYKMTRYLGSV